MKFNHTLQSSSVQQKFSLQQQTYFLMYRSLLELTAKTPNTNSFIVELKARRKGNTRGLMEAGTNAQHLLK